MWKKKIKNFVEGVMLLWCCLGLFVSLMGLLVTWKLALVLFCLWGITCVITLICIANTNRLY